MYVYLDLDSQNGHFDFFRLAVLKKINWCFGEWDMRWEKVWKKWEWQCWSLLKRIWILLEMWGPMCCRSLVWICSSTCKCWEMKRILLQTSWVCLLSARLQCQCCAQGQSCVDTKCSAGRRWHWFACLYHFHLCGRRLLTRGMDRDELKLWIQTRWNEKDILDGLPDNERRCSSVPATTRFQECSLVLRRCDELDKVNTSMDLILPSKSSSVQQTQQTVSNGNSVVSPQKQSRRYMYKICQIEGQGIVYLNSQKELNDHTKSVHFCVFTYRTRRCGKDFSSLSALKKHKLEHDLVMKSRFSCEKCDKTFVFTSELRYHQVVHSDRHQYKCSHCPYIFKLKGELTRHEVRHTGKILHCDFDGCEYTALEQCFLQEHM